MIIVFSKELNFEFGVGLRNWYCFPLLEKTKLEARQKMRTKKELSFLWDDIPSPIAKIFQK
ncbi:MAG: hypothetical protein A2V66_02085 [Ignavibacteria bacterium RBG_13_36_8]|nr:MAG: hypothetical protein A2V66_02085 [Ignavibacteria bacterium RBG_13_36_8]